VTCLQVDIFWACY